MHGIRSRYWIPSRGTEGAHCSHNFRIGLEADTIATALIDNLHCLQAKLPQHATRNDWYMTNIHFVIDVIDRGRGCAPSRR
jgi:hypothetical protein